MCPGNRVYEKKMINFIRKKNLQIWLPAYLRELTSSPQRRSSSGPVHVMVMFVDHYELAGKEPRLREWMRRYPDLALRHRDSDGICPKHTWFYALDLMREKELEEMRSLVDRGLGEVELHWHHSHDTAESFQDKLHKGLAIFQKHGYMMSMKEGVPGCFAFIHGNWSLDNSGGDKFCGVNNEIQLLKQAGCYADFTFPALYSTCQPATINSIYYVKDNGKPKSYDIGRLARVGVKEREDEFMIFQGPLTINWKDWRHKWHPTFEDGDICSDTHASSKRIDSWIRQNIHVRGREEWVFVKIFCHGGQDHRAVLGSATDSMFSYMEDTYNDGERYFLHYITAREAYNIVKAAEDGKTGNPHQYRDYLIKAPHER